MRLQCHFLLFIWFAIAWFQPAQSYINRGRAMPVRALVTALTRTRHISYQTAIAAKNSHKDIAGPEFSRIINVAQISPQKPTSCRLLAKPDERSGLAKRFDVPDLAYFASNVTLVRNEEYSIQISGSFEARVNYGKIHGVETIKGEFETFLLNNAEGLGSGMNIEDATDYDDEVEAGGNIDIGEISAQYFSMELT